MMKLSMGARGLTERFGNEKAFVYLKDAGFGAFDFGLDPLEKDVHPMSIDSEWRGFAKELRAASDAVGIPCTQTHAPFRWAAKYDDADFFEKVIFPRFVRSLEISSILGAEVCVVHPLHHYVYHGHEEEIFEKNMEFYNRLIPYAKEFDVKIAVENMFQLDARRRCPSHDTCSRADEFIRYIDTLNSEYIVGCVDTGHIALPQQDDEAWDVIRKLGHDRVKSLHIHDNDYRGDQHLLPYCGALNWDEVCRALGEIDYTGDFTYETGFVLGRMDEETLKIGLKYMGDIGHHLMAKIDAARPKN